MSINSKLTGLLQAINTYRGTSFDNLTDAIAYLLESQSWLKWILPNRLLLWNDEFDGDSLDTDVWGYETGYVRNNEDQLYTSDSKNVYVSDSVLHIKALKDINTTLENPAKTFYWSSGSIDSQIQNTGFSYGYGLIEIRAKIDTSKSGVWPAFWSRGASQPGERWPMCGEIDIGELFYSASKTVHDFSPGLFWYDWKSLTQQSCHATTTGAHSNASADVPRTNVDDQWHIYGMERTANMLTFYFDRVEICKINLDDIDDTYAKAAINQPMSVKLNLAMGSTGGSIDPSITSADYQIEYVRYYAPASVTEASDDFDFDFPDYMPSEVVSGRKIRVIPDVDMSAGKNQFLTLTSSNEAVATASSGQVNAIANGTTTLTLTDVNGNAKTKTLTVKDNANCAATEIRAIDVVPTSVINRGSVSFRVRAVPNWATDHSITASLSSQISGVSVSAELSAGTIPIAKHSTKYTTITVVNDTAETENRNVNIVLSASGGASKTIPITIVKRKAAFDTTGMTAFYDADSYTESDDGLCSIADSAGSNDALNGVYLGSTKNKVCYIPALGIQAQAQNATFASGYGNGRFFGEFDPDKDYTVVVSGKMSATTYNDIYVNYSGIFSIAHAGIGDSAVVSNTTDGAHGFVFGFDYTSGSEGTVQKGKGLYVSTSNEIARAKSATLTHTLTSSAGYPHSSGSVYTYAFIYHADSKTFEAYLWANGNLIAMGYPGIQYANNQTNYSAGVYGLNVASTLDATILAEAETDPFYFRYGNGGQKPSDFVRAIAIYEDAKSFEFVESLGTSLTNYYWED